MKYIRFMSKKEFQKLLKGEILTNYIKHKIFTNSVGFCFMKGNETVAEFDYQFLSGIVSTEVVVVFETSKKLKKGYGIYADPYGSFFDTIMEEEYSTEQYSKETMKPLKYCTNFDKCYGDEEWIWKNTEE